MRSDPIDRLKAIKNAKSPKYIAEFDGLPACVVKAPQDRLTCKSSYRCTQLSGRFNARSTVSIENDPSGSAAIRGAFP
jgi:hypothetical protein